VRKKYTKFIVMKVNEPFTNRRMLLLLLARLRFNKVARRYITIA